MELPDMATKLTWDNALLVSPATAKRSGDGQMRVTWHRGRELTCRAARPGSPVLGKLYLGYGARAGWSHRGVRSVVARAEEIRGRVNAYRVRSKRVWTCARTPASSPTRNKLPQATTQDKHTMDRIGKFGTEERMPMLVRQATLEEYKKEPDFAKHAVAPPAAPVALEGAGEIHQPQVVDEHRPQQVHRLQRLRRRLPGGEQHPRRRLRSAWRWGREMQWLRIDRYFEGEDPEQPEDGASARFPACTASTRPASRSARSARRRTSHDGLNDMTVQPLYRYPLLLEQLPVQGTQVQLLQLPRRAEGREESGQGDDLQPGRHGAFPRA
jgi:molybdopterin-containing oxidoreductase family iron-sulfur binding subunit